MATYFSCLCMLFGDFYPGGPEILGVFCCCCFLMFKVWKFCLGVNHSGLDFSMYVVELFSMLIPGYFLLLLIKWVLDHSFKCWFNSIVLFSFSEIVRMLDLLHLFSTVLTNPFDSPFHKSNFLSLGCFPAFYFQWKFLYFYSNIFSLGNL